MLERRRLRFCKMEVMTRELSPRRINFTLWISVHTRRLFGAYRPGNQGTHSRTRWDATGGKPNGHKAFPDGGLRVGITPDGVSLTGSQGVKGSNPFSSTGDKYGGTSGLAWGSATSGDGARRSLCTVSGGFLGRVLGRGPYSRLKGPKSVLATPWHPWRIRAYLHGSAETDRQAAVTMDQLFAL